jgi:putative ABC transport system substrate-binding protein
VRRRDFVQGIVGSALAWPLSVAAQESAGRYRIGVLAQDLQPGLLETFSHELAKLGYVGENSFAIDLRNAAGVNESLPRLADELLRLKVNVIVAVNTPAAKVAKQATKTVPIVIMRVVDPVKSGLIDSLARPGGNITGLNFMPDELGAKDIELLREILPNISRVGAFYQGDNSGAFVVAESVASRGAQLGVRVRYLPVYHPNDYADAFEQAAQARLEALFVMDDGAITKQRNGILTLAANYRLPIVAIYKDFAEAGAIIAYGPRLSVVYRRAAQYVDKILKGQPARDLPVEQPNEFDLLINLKTAKALGLIIPPALLARADEIIE